MTSEWPESYTIRARQALTMTGWEDKGPLDAELGIDALRERDADIVGLIEDAAIEVHDGVITYVGPFDEQPEPSRPPVREIGLAMPAWIECHTHALFGGARADEFGVRNAGVPYVQILESGGGILSTVEATRASSDAELRESLARRLDAFAAQGIGTVEVKTGYGLALEEELRHLRLIEEAAADSPLRVTATFLGAHAVPKAWRDDVDGYVEHVIEEMIPAVADQGIATACDVFCDRGAFSLDQSERILRAGLDAGLEARIHAEEITYTGGAEMAATLGARSADHLEHIDDAGVEALVEQGCVGVLLPGVTVFLDLAERAPARALVDTGGVVALSTDFNPGSAMTQNLALMVSLGCSLHKLTPGEALWAVTAGAARAVGPGSGPGTIEVGEPADLALFDAEDFSRIPYELGRAWDPELLVDGVAVGYQFPR